MRRALIRFSLCLTITLVLLVGAARAIGSMSQPPIGDMIAQFACEPKPCWAGIQPSVTSIEDALTTLRDDTNFSHIEYRPLNGALCWNWQPQWHNRAGVIFDGCYDPDPEGLTSVLFLNYRDDGLRLGDVLALLGRPSTSALCKDLRYGMIDLPTVRIYVAVPDNRLRIEPSLTVIGITYYARSAELPRRAIEQRWAGFSRWANVWNKCDAE